MDKKRILASVVVFLILAALWFTCNTGTGKASTGARSGRRPTASRKFTCYMRSLLIYIGYFLRAVRWKIFLTTGASAGQDDGYGISDADWVHWRWRCWDARANSFVLI